MNEALFLMNFFLDENYANCGMCFTSLKKPPSNEFHLNLIIRAGDESFEKHSAQREATVHIFTFVTKHSSNWIIITVSALLPEFGRTRDA